MANTAVNICVAFKEECNRKLSRADLEKDLKNTAPGWTVVSFSKLIVSVSGPMRYANDVSGLLRRHFRDLPVESYLTNTGEPDNSSITLGKLGIKYRPAIDLNFDSDDDNGVILQPSDSDDDETQPPVSTPLAASAVGTNLENPPTPMSPPSPIPLNVADDDSDDESQASKGVVRPRPIANKRDEEDEFSDGDSIINEMIESVEPSAKRYCSCEERDLIHDTLKQTYSVVQALYEATKALSRNVTALRMAARVQDDPVLNLTTDEQGKKMKELDKKMREARQDDILRHPPYTSSPGPFSPSSPFPSSP